MTVEFKNFINLRGLILRYTFYDELVVNLINVNNEHGFVKSVDEIRKDYEILINYLLENNTVRNDDLGYISTKDFIYNTVNKYFELLIEVSYNKKQNKNRNI